MEERELYTAEEVKEMLDAVDRIHIYSKVLRDIDSSLEKDRRLPGLATQDKEFRDYIGRLKEVRDPAYEELTCAYRNYSKIPKSLRGSLEGVDLDEIELEFGLNLF